MSDCNQTPNLNCGPGIPGKKGDPGVSIAIRKTVEPPGNNLTYGGWKIEFGPDPDNDNIPNTILHTIYLPNGAPGLSRAIKVTVIPVSIAYPAGGYRIDTGDDTNNDGVPDANIVSSYVLNGLNGSAGISPVFQTGVTTTLAPGAPSTSQVISLGANTYQINIGVPQGLPGVAGATTTSGVTVGGVTIPDCLTALLSGATTLSDYLTVILTQLCNVMSQTLNGSPGDFAAMIADPLQIFFPNSGNDIPIVFLNDYQNGGFDNGGNWNGARYKNNGWAGKIYLADVNIKVLVSPTANETISFVINKCNSDGTVNAVLGTSTMVIAGGAAVNSITTLTTGTIPVAASLTSDQYIQIRAFSNIAGIKGTYELNSGLLTNVI
jgi:hypothetical protein